MRKFIVILLWVIGVASPMHAWAWGTSCDAASKEPKPEWVSRIDFSIAGHYVGVGMADRDGKSKDEQGKVSEDNAKAHLVQQIEVTIRSENEQSTRVNKGRVQQDAMSRVNVKAEEVLRDLKIKDRWIDKETCTLYTLVIISKESVAQAKREKLMRGRLERFKTLFADGTDRDRNRDINVRRKYLEEAQSLLKDTDFSLLPEELGKDVYANRLADAMEQINKEASQAKGRMALFAINQDGALQADVMAKMLDRLRASEPTADRLMAECSSAEECISRAKERGFSMLALLKASSQMGTSPMGALKGTLTISRTVYDIESRKILKGPDTASAQVIGWSNEELDWNAAAEKAMQGLK